MYLEKIITGEAARRPGDTATVYHIAGPKKGTLIMIGPQIGIFLGHISIHA